MTQRRAILLARDLSQVTTIECESAEIQGTWRRHALTQRPRLTKWTLARARAMKANVGPSQTVLGLSRGELRHSAGEQGSRNV